MRIPWDHKESPSDQAHKLPALMQAIAVMPVLEPWTPGSSAPGELFGCCGCCVFNGLVFLGKS